jgi:hypothetical protein
MFRSSRRPIVGFGRWMLCGCSGSLEASEAFAGEYGFVLLLTLTFREGRFAIVNARMSSKRASADALLAGKIVLLANDSSTGIRILGDFGVVALSL